MDLSNGGLGPASAGRTAQLLLALLLLAVLPAAFNHPLQQHIVRLDLTPQAEEPPPPLPDAAAGGLPRLSVTLLNDVAPIGPLGPGPIHRLVVTADGRMMLDGATLDLIGLRQRLDLIEVEGEWVSFEPDPNARYELFVEALATAKRARIERLQVPAGRYALAIDGVE
jgi:hypothetical protein